MCECVARRGWAGIAYNSKTLLRLIRLSQYRSHPASLSKGRSEINPERAQKQKQTVVKETFSSVLGMSIINVLGFLYPGFTAILPYMYLGEDMARRLLLLWTEFPWPLARRSIPCQPPFLLRAFLFLPSQRPYGLSDSAHP